MRIDAVRTARSLNLPAAPFEEVCVVVHTDATDLVHLSPSCGGWRGERTTPVTHTVEELADHVLCARCASVVPVSEAAENYARVVLRCDAVGRRLSDARRGAGMDAVRAAALALLGAEVVAAGELGTERCAVDALVAAYRGEAHRLLEQRRGEVEGFCLWAAGSLDSTWGEVLDGIGGESLARRLAPGRGYELLTAAHQAMRTGGMDGARETLQCELERLGVPGARDLSEELCSAWRSRIEQHMAASGERVMSLRLQSQGSEMLTGPRVDLLALAVLLGRERAGGMLKLLVVPGWVCELIERWGAGAVGASDLGEAGPGDTGVLGDAARLMAAGNMPAEVALRLARRLGD